MDLPVQDVKLFTDVDSAVKEADVEETSPRASGMSESSLGESPPSEFAPGESPLLGTDRPAPSLMEQSVCSDASYVKCELTSSNMNVHDLRASQLHTPSEYR